MDDQARFKPESAIYTPQQVSTYGVQAIKEVETQTGRGVEIDVLSPYFAPVMPGQVCAIIAQTSHYKSGFLHYIEHCAAEKIMAAGREDEVIVHVSVEEEIEEQAFLEFARYSGEEAGKLAHGQVQDWTKLHSAAVKVGTVPIYRIGSSLARAEDMPLLYMSNMVRSIKYLAEKMFDWRPRVAAIFFDYLQAFPIDPTIRKSVADSQRRLQVRSDIYRLRQAAAYFKCPVFVAVQAKQHLDGANAPVMLPGVYDGEESSSIAQRCDRVISLWMPKQTHQIGSSFETGGRLVTVDDNMLWIKVCKQRGGLPAGKVFPCRIDYRTNSITVERIVSVSSLKV